MLVSNFVINMPVDGNFELTFINWMAVNQSLGIQAGSTSFDPAINNYSGFISTEQSGITQDFLDYRAQIISELFPPYEPIPTPTEPGE